MSDPSPNTTHWKRKLAAFLHDPPHKQFDICGHEDARDVVVCRRTPTQF